MARRAGQVFALSLMVIGAAGVPADVQAWGDLFAAIGSVAGQWVLIGVGLTALFVLQLVPRFTQTLTATSDTSLEPEFDVVPQVGLRMREIEGGYACDSEAVLWVRNAKDQGGEDACARGVTPEIEILHRGAVHTRNVGWETVVSRDLRATRESYPVHVAFKQAGSTWPTADLRSPTQTMGGPLWGPTWAVRLTLRGDSWSTPIVHHFVLHNVAGASGGLRLERAG